MDVRGLSRARNAGIAVASGDWLYWFDDDEEMNAQAVESLDELIVRHPQCDFFGGPYLKPVYLEDGFDCDATGAPPIEVLIDRDTWGTGPFRDVWGGNVAYSKRLIENVGRYDEFLGVGSPLFQRSEDLDYNVRAVSQGFKGMFSPRMVITHTFGARPESSREHIDSLGFSSVIRWKADKMPSLVDPAVACRARPYRRSRLLAALPSLGLVGRQDFRNWRFGRRVRSWIDSEFALEADGILRLRDREARLSVPGFLLGPQP